MCIEKDPILYHQNVYLPKAIAAFLKNKYLRLAQTKNATQVAQERNLPQPGYVVLTETNVIEVGCNEAGEIQNAVVKVDWNTSSDLYLSLALDWMHTGIARVRTMWGQDKHGRPYMLSTELYQGDPSKPGLRTVIAAPPLLNPVFQGTF